MNKYVYGLLAIALLIAVNVGISRLMINSSVGAMKSQWATQSAKPKFIVVDEAILHEQLKLQPDGQETTPAQLLADRENLFTALRLQNYIVLSSTSLLTYPLSSELNNVNMREVRAFLSANNVTVSTASDHEQTVRFAQRLIESQLKVTQN